MPSMPFDDEQQDYIPGFEPPPPQQNGNNPFASVMFGDEAPGNQAFQLGDDGQMHLVVPDEELMPALAHTPHRDNLAEHMEDQDLSQIAGDLLEMIDDDIESRAPWIDRFRDGYRMMGWTQDEVDDGPFPGSSTAVMPLISEATVQFWAKSLAELVPPDGPCRGTILGKASTLQVERAKRVADYQNYEIMFLDRSWYADMSRMLFALPYTGTCFKKSYRDEQAGCNISEYVKAEDFICNYAMTDLQASPRYTHRLWRTKNQIRKAQIAGVYRDIELGDAEIEDLPEETIIKAEANDFEASSNRSSDSRHEVYEVYCELDLPGAEHKDAKGQPTGIELPYIVTIERKSQKILAIYRDWKEQDPLQRRNVIFTKYDFLPSDGFYGWGLLHMVGGMQQAATGALRAIIDGAATASLQGGFVSADAALKDQTLSLEPGIWKSVNSSAEDLNKAFWSPPVKEPSPVLFQVLGFLVQRVEKFVSTTDMQTGTTDAKNMPVGSTVAIMEAGQKVFSTIHKGLHKALTDELRQRYELIQVYMPTGGYPYDVEGGHEGILAEDFQPGVVVVPVSDPNIFSDTQRVAQNQAVYDLACQNPDIIKKREAVIRVLKGIKVPDIEELLVDNSPPPPMDAPTEIQSLLRGQPVQAYPDQDHASHLQHYWAFMNNPQFGANPMVQQQIGPVAMALIGQRLAYAWAAGVRQQGVPVNLLPPPMSDPNQPAPPPGPAPEQQGPQAGLPPQQQLGPEQISQMAAQFTQQLTQIPGLPPPPGASGEDKGGLTNEQEAHFRDRETQAKEQESQAKVQNINANTAKTQQQIQIEAASKAKADDIKAQQEGEKLNQEAQKTELANQKEARQAAHDQAKHEALQAQAVAAAQAVQHAEEKHKLDMQMAAQAHQQAQEQAEVKGAVETAIMAKQGEQQAEQDAEAHDQQMEQTEVQGEQADESHRLSTKKAEADIEHTKVKTKQAAKPKPAAKPKGKSK